ncbi:MAG: 2,4-dienoyl-CoA reductase (NADPH2) [Bermanella sp.]|jgi:2,4-dienoyl-CoA reductase (NADPH2)
MGLNSHLTYKLTFMEKMITNTELNDSHQANTKVIFRPLEFKNLTVKNRIFRSNISGMFDEYNGFGGHTRLNWEEQFAEGGVGAIISSYTPVSVRGRILTRYAMMDHDNKIPFWHEVGERVHQHDCKFIMQLSHSGRQQDMGGVENQYMRGLSSTNKKDYFHGLLAQAMTVGEIKMVVSQFGDAARRAREAGLDGVELHGANGYLITQFLSSGINDRTDEYGGSIENRSRFVLEIIRDIRQKAGRDFHLQMKINAADYNDWLYPWQHAGNTLEDTFQICSILEDGGNGIDAFHISSGSTFPHPRNPPGDFPVQHAIRWYDGMLSQGVRTRFNMAIFRTPGLGQLFRQLWLMRRGNVIEGINAEFAREIKQRVEVPVITTGGFQHAAIIAQVIKDGWMDAVSIGRPLIANPDLPKIFRTQNGPSPKRECTYCNKCLLNDLENPLGCYELSRYEGDSFEEVYENMLASVMSVFYPPAYIASTKPETKREPEKAETVNTTAVEHAAPSVGSTVEFPEENNHE